MRLQLALNVRDLEAAIEFYSKDDFERLRSQLMG